MKIPKLKKGKKEDRVALSPLLPLSTQNRPLTLMTPCGPAAALTEGVGSPGLAPEEAARVCCCSSVVVDEDDEPDADEELIVCSLPARLPASLRARSSVWDIF